MSMREGADAASEITGGDDIIRRYIPIARNVASRFRIPGADHDDQVQIAMIAIWQQAQRGEISGALATIAAKRELIDELRRVTGSRTQHPRTVPASWEGLPGYDPPVPPWERPEHAVLEGATRVVELLEPLPRRHRLIALRLASGYGPRAIGAELGLAEARISQIVARKIRPRLRDQLAQEERR